ncbi:hypothetical protein [Methylobacterium sp. ap11]|uniref:hypothetical protein n=1 Tax=Methylobacterium sp. ap11 TaxID=1761799 RepID=UPI000B874CE5|nr:hypothetical protein [Methylobacterium sp. ap11]
MSLMRERCVDFGPTLSAGMLWAHHQLTVSLETLRGWMSAASLWLLRQQRRSLHQPRLQRERLGELVQIDDSKHRRFEEACNCGPVIRRMGRVPGATLG